MDKKAIIDYIESSFIKDILSKNDITDISYNGRDIYYVSNELGRKKSAVVVSNDEVKDFLRQIANISEKQFNYLNPIMDLNIGKYRINAVNNSVARLGEESVFTFEIRIASEKPRITSDHSFVVEEVELLFDLLLKSHHSIVICGVPGVGKTEFQRYLISRINSLERIIIIDNTIELMMLQKRTNLDITLWQADEHNKEASVTNLIKNGLRSNPDWMIVSEARGEEMNDLLLSAMTGVPLITTIHSIDAFNAPSRMAKAIMLSEKKMSYEDIITNIKEHFKIFVYLKKKVLKNKSIKRYISSIVEIDSNGLAHEIYSDNLIRKKFAKVSKNMADTLLNIESNKKLRRFIKYE